FESRCDSTSGANGSGSPFRNVAHGALFRHWPSGKSPAFWSAFGGMAYWPTVSVVCDRESAGLAEPSDEGLVSAHTSRSVEVPVALASPAAFELMKYSVPPAPLS